MRSLLIFVVLMAVSAVFAGEAGNMHAGFGYGDQYGKWGANIDYRVTDQVSPTIGVGLNGQGGWFGGVRYYLQPSTASSRGRFTAGVARINPDGPKAATRAFVSIGWTWANEKNNFSGPSIDVSTAGRVSIGWQF